MTKTLYAAKCFNLTRIRCSNGALVNSKPGIWMAGHFASW